MLLQTFQCKHNIQFIESFTFPQYWYPKCGKFTVGAFCTTFIKTFQCIQNIQFAVPFTFKEYLHSKYNRFTAVALLQFTSQLFNICIGSSLQYFYFNVMLTSKMHYVYSCRLGFSSQILYTRNTTCFLFIVIWEFRGH